MYFWFRNVFFNLTLNCQVVLFELPIHSFHRRIVCFITTWRCLYQTGLLNVSCDTIHRKCREQVVPLTSLPLRFSVVAWQLRLLKINTFDCFLRAEKPHSSHILRRFFQKAWNPKAAWILLALKLYLLDYLHLLALPKLKKALKRDHFWCQMYSQKL